MDLTVAVLLVYPEESGKWQQSKILINLKQFHVAYKNFSIAVTKHATQLHKDIFIIQCKNINPCVKMSLLPTTGQQSPLYYLPWVVELLGYPTGRSNIILKMFKLSRHVQPLEYISEYDYNLLRKQSNKQISF